jgi:lantibiotic modifying enzyme
LFTGILGVAVAAERVARLTGDEDLRASARRIVDEWLRSGEQKLDPGFDLISGRSGVIIGLLALNAAWGDDELTAAAAAHGRALMRTARRSDEGDSWASPNIPAERDLTGLSHGASGPAWALGELAAATGEPSFREGAHRALQYERTLFDPAAGNWPDFRTNRPSGFEVAPFATLWCHGATGIGLARLRLSELLDDPLCEKEARLAMLAVEKAVKRALDTPGVDWSLCHGITGNADALLTAGRSTESASYLELARAVGRAGAARLERWIHPGAAEIPIGLMTGLAGIGLFHLRLCDDGVPSVQLLSPEIRSPALSA